MGSSPKVGKFLWAGRISIRREGEKCCWEKELEGLLEGDGRHL
jgi:hypothetical protein